MNESWENQADGKASGQKGWYVHLADSIAAEKCPYCGEHIFIAEKINEDTCKKSYFFQCSSCRWRNC
jgi:predicted RNA-binding Zn-ribbon protein involved in translation (DUF1610 family)